MISAILGIMLYMATIIKRRYNQYPADFEKMIFDAYTKGKSSVALKQEYGISPDTVLSIVKRLGGKTRTTKETSRKYDFNHDYFETIDTEDKAYFLGLFLADGCVGKKEVILQLNLKDKQILQSFLKCIDGNNKIRYGQQKTNFNFTSNYCRISLRSDKMINDLNRLGLCSNKTYEMKNLPRIDQNLQKHFWRGVLDGDGSVSVSANKKYLDTAICGHPITMVEFIKFLSQNRIKNSGIKPDHSIFRVRVNRKYNLKFLKLLYSNANPDLFLKRKYEKYLNYLNSISN